MEWNVFHDDWNQQKITKFNIFKHSSFKDDVIKNLKKCETKEDFAEELRKDLMYYFWCKAEYEIMLSPWIIGGKPVKVDIYTQVMLNWDKFLDYVWSFKGAKNL